MTTRRGSPRRSRSSRAAPRRKTGWMGAVTEPTTVGPGAQSFVNLTSELLDVTQTPLARQALTIMRIVGMLRVNSTDANLSAEAAFGFIMVDGDAGVAAALPDPLLDVDAPWLWWQRRVVLPPSDAGQQINVDSKSRRRFRGNDDSLNFIIDNDDATQSLEFALGLRVLIAL